MNHNNQQFFAKNEFIPHYPQFTINHEVANYIPNENLQEKHYRFVQEENQKIVRYTNNLIREENNDFLKKLNKISESEYKAFFFIDYCLKNTYPPTLSNYTDADYKIIVLDSINRATPSSEGHFNHLANYKARNLIDISQLDWLFEEEQAVVYIANILLKNNEGLSKVFNTIEQLRVFITNRLIFESNYLEQNYANNKVYYRFTSNMTSLSNLDKFKNIEFCDALHKVYANSNFNSPKVNWIAKYEGEDLDAIIEHISESKQLILTKFFHPRTDKDKVALIQATLLSLDDEWYNEKLVITNNDTSQREELTVQIRKKLSNKKGYNKAKIPKDERTITISQTTYTKLLKLTDHYNIKETKLIEQLIEKEYNGKIEAT